MSSDYIGSDFGQSVYETIQVVVADRVAYIIFNKPPLNIFSIEMMKEVNHALSRLTKITYVCAVVFAATPTSKAFSAGVSIEEHRQDMAYQMLENFHNIFRALHNYSKPTIAVVNGPALGGGCELVAFCDVVIASEKAKFGQPEIRLGVFPPMAAVILPRIIGLKKATEMILTGEPIDAFDAQNMGLVNFVVSEEQLEERTLEVISSFRDNSASVLEVTRRAIFTGFFPNFEEVLSKVEEQYLMQLMNLADPHEGLRAFMEKRKPVWRHK
ncbi:MAG: enoyl-CoA hydratase/isomerase family protein [Blastocatellia bacterium]